MDFDQLKQEASTLFPLACNFAIEHQGTDNSSLESLKRLCWEHHASLGFDCMADCFAAVVPKVEGTLSLDAWCDSELEVSGWKVRITMRPFYLGASYAHFEIRHAGGPIPGFTETGYRSVFTPMATFAEFSPEEFLELSVPKVLPAQQLTLF